MNADLSRCRLLASATIRDAMRTISADRMGIALVLDSQDHLIAVITDGDLRRAILAGTELDAPIAEVMRFRAGPEDEPVVAPIGSSRTELLGRMRSLDIRHLPLVDETGRVRDLAVLDDLVSEAEVPLTAVIMAGGEGARLRPLTLDTPKPLLPVADRPIIERMLDQLQAAGVRNVSVTTHYRPEKIIERLGNGRQFGVEISYVNEERPLGTAGALRLMPAPRGPQLVVNGDILTQLDFRNLVSYHRDHRAQMTVGVRRFEMPVPYGVVETDGARITRLDEKPTLRFLINAGIYLLEPDVYHLIPTGRRFEMTELIDMLVRAGLPVVSFPIHEYWVDIGRLSDYERAVEDAKRGIA